MKLYYSPGSCSLASHIVAEEAGLSLDYEKVDIRAHKTEKGTDYTTINPKGYVPCLGLDDGGILTENVAVLQFLGDRKPEAGLVPAPTSPERYRLQEWLAFINSELHKSFGPLFRSQDESVKNEAKEKIATRYAIVEKHLQGKSYLMGANFSVADAYLYVTLRWAGALKIDMSGFPNLTALRERAEARSGVQAALKAEGLIK